MGRTDPLIGAHLSIAGGLNKAIERADSIGCRALQIFTHSNRQWSMKPLGSQEIENFKAAKKSSGIKSYMVHASYLINLATNDLEVRRKSVEGLIQEIERCNQLDIPYLVVHPGARLQNSLEDSLILVSQGLDKALEVSGGSTMILVENMAGQGSVIGRSLEELLTIRTLSHHKRRIGFCIDTCHLFASGFAINTQDGYEKFLHDFDTLIGLEHLKAVHLNDSKSKLGSSVDRHDHIGAGQIGLKTFEWIMNDERLIDIPKVLETPKGEDTDVLAEDRKNLAILRSLIK